MAFKDKSGGNEWWVEAIVTASGTSVSKVEVMDDGGPWATMAYHPEWGSYALSYRVESTHRVTFRATTPGGTVTSCPFTHPAGVEQCGTPPPPPPPPPPTSWQTTIIGKAGVSSYGGDMALADVDNDGRRDVVVGRSDGLYHFEWMGPQSPAWASEKISPRLFDTMAAGDADNDGTAEVYGMALGSRMDLVQYRYANGGWVQTTLAAFAQPMAGDMTLGNIDGVAGQEIYAGLVATECDPGPEPLCTSTSTVYLVRKEAAGWSATNITTLAGSIDSMWIGDGDNNGRFELYVGHGTRHGDHASQVQLVNGQWVVTSLEGSGSEYGDALVVAGDGDRDGRNEVYQVNAEGVFLKHSYDQVSGWSTVFMFGGAMTSPEGAPVSPSSLFLGDADSDGTQELYLATYSGEVYQVRWTGSAWQATRIAYPQDPFRGQQGGNGILVVGDGDQDGRREVYTAIAFVEANTGEQGVTDLFKVALPAGTFDATFTAVRGNEWWIQANVATAGGTLSNVDVRLNGGAWQPLQKQSWGGWAASYHAVQGTVVQLRATSTTGATDLGDCHRWIPASNTDAAKTTCPGAPPPPPPPPPPGAFDATFTNVKGNQYWVEAVITANAPINGAWVYVDCQGDPLDMTYNARWGKWTLGNVNIPGGTKLVIEAYGEGGADQSIGYIWPNATPTSGC